MNQVIALLITSLFVVRLTLLFSKMLYSFIPVINQLLAENFGAFNALLWFVRSYMSFQPPAGIMLAYKVRVHSIRRREVPPGGDRRLLLQPQPYLQRRRAVLPQRPGAERRDDAADLPWNKSAASRWAAATHSPLSRVLSVSGINLQLMRFQEAWREGKAYIVPTVIALSFLYPAEPLISRVSWS